MPETSDAHILKAHSDESGNTGQNLFDPAQPTFWTGTLLASSDLDTEAAGQVRELARTLKVEELHAAELGTHGVEAAAGAIQEVLNALDCKLLFTLIDKRYFARLKLADTILDSGVNAAVSPVHYNNRFFRLLLAYFLVINISPQSEEEFWSAYERLDLPTFQRVLRRLHWNVENKVKDPRVKELLLDAVSWGLDHPKELLNSKRSDLDAPNVAAMGLLVDGLHTISIDTGAKVGRFVADEQNQFAKALKFAYEVTSRFAIPIDPFSWSIDFKEMHSFLAPIEIIPSSKSAGLQIIDVILWLAKRAGEREFRLGEASQRLIQAIMHRGIISEITLRRLASEISDSIRTLAEREISAEEEERAKMLIAEYEAHRKSRMSEEA